MWASIVGEQVHCAVADLALANEHRLLIELIDELHLQMLRPASISHQRFVLRVLSVYLRVNSLGEEAVMDEFSFPLRKRHQKEHRSHYRAVRLLDEQIIGLDRDGALASVNTLRQTILDHIREKDQEVVDWTHHQTGGRRASA